MHNYMYVHVHEHMYSTCIPVPAPASGDGWPAHISISHGRWLLVGRCDPISWYLVELSSASSAGIVCVLLSVCG